MQKFEGTLITDNGLNLLTTVNGGDDKIQYTKAVLAADDFTQVSSTEIQKITGLTIKMSSPISINSRINDTINLSASFTNAAITEDFDFYCIGWYAKGIKDSTEYLIAVSPSTVKQTMPAGSNNAATASISPKYAMALSQNAEVEITTNPAGSVTKDQLDKAINDLFGKSIINDGTSMTGSQDLNSIYGTYLGNINGDDKPQNVPSGFGTGKFISYGDGESTHPITQLIYDDVNNVSYFRSYDPAKNKWTDWDLIITKSQLNAVLPTDIARTGSDQEFTGKNTFDTAPIDKTTGKPFITKDGVPAVPSTLADTTKPANFTAGLQSGGVSVATSDDLKSVEESAWRELDLSGTSGIYQGKILIKIDKANKYIYFIMNAQMPLRTYSKGTKIIDLSSVVTGLSSAHGYLQGWIAGLENPFEIKGSTISTSGTCLTLGNDYSGEGVSRIATEADPGKQYCYAVYNSLVN